MKKINLLAFGVLVLGLSACGNSGNKPENIKVGNIKVEGVNVEAVKITEEKITNNLEMKNNQISKSISEENFQEYLTSGEYVLIDVRTESETSGVKIKKEALEIDFYGETFKSELDKLDKNKKYLIYCHSGNRSGKSLKIMKDLGFNEVYDLSGGILHWKGAVEEK